jgi:hypothetical protein
VTADLLLIGVTVFIGIMSVSTALRQGADDPNWELRWRALDPSYRDWLAAMTTDPSWMSTLSDPEEVELAKGFHRRERRGLAYYDMAASVIAALVVALTLSGMTHLSVAGIALGLLAVIRFAVESWHQRQIRQKVKLGFEPGELPTQLTQTPP